MATQTYPVGAIAALLTLEERRIQQLVKEGILPRPTRGVYDPIACVHAYINYLRKLITGSGELSLTEERTRLTKLQADLAELELKKARGEIIQTKVAMDQWADIVTASRQKMLSLPTRAAPLLSARLGGNTAEIKSMLQVLVDEILIELANPNLRGEASTGAESHPEGAETLHTAAETDSKRVGRRKKKTLPGK